MVPGPSAGARETPMNAKTSSAALALMTWLAAPAAFAEPAVPGSDPRAIAGVEGDPVVAPIDSEPPVFQYNLSGPRIGVTLLPKGGTQSQFGWHSENQAA